jgi:5'-nucleotidase
MRFLLTNDDGIDAKGLALLAEVSAQHGEVTVLAPLAEQSGVGHRVNTRGCLAIEDRGNARYALAGTPADCTRVGMMGLKLEVDWVLSGLNHGGNLGVDIPMSGTVAAAREGAILGRQAIAISQIISMKYPPDRERIKRLTARVIAELLQKPLAEGKFYNVNLPFAPESDEPELVYCPPDPSPHDVRYLQSDEGYTYAGVFLDRPRKPGCDVDVAFQGKVTISVLSVV